MPNGECIKNIPLHAYAAERKIILTMMDWNLFTMYESFKHLRRLRSLKQSKLCTTPFGPLTENQRDAMIQ